jgi:quinol monooxygenase YgiN
MELGWRISIMIIATLKMIPRDEKRREILDILLTVKGPVLAERGCLSCGIYEEHDEEQSLLYVELWRSLEELERHIRSSSYAKILEAMELSLLLPEISFFESKETDGLALIENLRSSDRSGLSPLSLNQGSADAGERRAGKI